jgi:glycine betaine/proline transport system permease protein
MVTLTTDRTVRIRRPSRSVLVLAVILGWASLAVALSGRSTLVLGPAELTWLHRRLNDLRDAADAGREDNPLFLHLINQVRVAVDVLVRFVQHLIAQPSGGRPVPEVGWLGVVAVATFVAGTLGNLRVAALTATGLIFLGLQGLWQESMDTLALTLAAVALAVLLGIPLGIAAGVNDGFGRWLTPLLDVAQTLPTFVYLAPLTLLFLIGPASATITTLVYAMPPVIKLTAHGIRSVPTASVEASTCLGATGRQRLRHVLLPMARRSIVLGVNQTIMAALSMVTIAALIDAPGLGKTVLKALQTLDVGTAFNAGLAIVILAVVLDRVTTAAAGRSGRSGRSGRRHTRETRLRLAATLAAAAFTGWLVVLSRTYVWAARFPDGGTDTGSPDLGGLIARIAGTGTQWVQDVAAGPTNATKDLVTALLIDPLQALLTDSPWWLVTAAVIALASIVAGSRAAATAACCLGLLIGTGLWSDAMTTLASTLVATAAVMAWGLVLGVWMGRDLRVDRLLRPLLDAGQTMPAFVYLVPFLALFAAGRFTAIVAAVVYAAPVTIKIVADGVRAVPATTVEAARAAGSSRWQLITKVQLPMSRKALALALNQGLIYVLSMVVVGGLVGAGALGFDVVAGFSQGQLYGKGLAAGAAIVLLGVMLDRISQGAAARVGNPVRPRTV